LVPLNWLEETDSPAHQGTCGKDKAPPQPDDDPVVDPNMKTAAERAVAAALGNIPGLKELLSAQELSRLQTQMLQNSDVAGPSGQGKRSGKRRGSYIEYPGRWAGKLSGTSHPFWLLEIYKRLRDAL